MKKNFIICFVITFVTLLNGKKVLSQENVEADLSQESVEAGDPICEIASREVNLNNYDGKLSDYWAQEYIGSDLFREEFSDWLEENPPPTNLITIIDTLSSGSHGISVRNLIAHQKKQAVLPNLKIKNFWFRGLMDISVISNFLAIHPSFSFVNNSMGWGSPDYLGYKKISDRGSIIVSSSGNYFPQKMSSDKRKAGESLNIIIVGSLRPSGLISDFSQEGESVSILAPSNHEILTIGINGEEELFGGTSGATPLVTGSLAAFEWITNYHPTIDELKLLLKKTAIPSLMSHQRPRKNGDGTVNAYKIARVAEKISLGCQNENPQERVTCIQEGIKRDETYQFPEFSRNDLTDTLNEHFPDCVSELELGEPTGSPHIVCENKKEAVKKLRKEAHLDPYNKNLWKALSCIYKKEGFLFNSIYYNTTALATEYPINHDKVLLTVQETLSAREENFLKVLSDQNLSQREFNQVLEENLSFELMMLFRIRSSFFPHTPTHTPDPLFLLLQEKLQFFESYEYMDPSIRSRHLSLVMHLSGLLSRKEDRAFFQNKGFSRDTFLHPEVSHQDFPENHLNICDLIDFSEERNGEKGEEREVPFNIEYNYSSRVRGALIRSSVFLENEDEKWSLLKKGLEDENLILKKAAVRHFYTLEGDERKLQLLNCLDNSNYNLEDLNQEMVKIARSLKNEKSRENFFRRILSDETKSSNLKLFIIGDLWSLNEETRSELLKAYFKHKDPVLRETVIFSLWMLDDESEIKRLLNSALKDNDGDGDEDFNIKSSALLSIGRNLIHDRDKIPFIDFALEDTDPNIQALSMKMIWFLAEPSMVEKYFHLGFQHSAFEVRSEAIRQVPYLNRSIQQKVDLFKEGMKDLNPFVQLVAVESSFRFSQQIIQVMGAVQLVVDFYRTILSTISSLLHQILNYEEHLNFIIEHREVVSNLPNLLDETLDGTLRSILSFFTFSQNKDLELSFLDFFKEELRNTQANVKVIYLFKALVLVITRQNLYFSEDESNDETIQIELVRLLEEMIEDEENSIDRVIQIVDISLKLLFEMASKGEREPQELQTILLNFLEQGLNRSRDIISGEIIKGIFLFNIFSRKEINLYGSQQELLRIEREILNLLN